VESDDQGQWITYTADFTVTDDFLHGLAKNEHGQANAVCDTMAQVSKRIFNAGGYQTRMVGSYIAITDRPMGHLQVIGSKPGSNELLVQNNDNVVFSENALITTEGAREADAAAELLMQPTAEGGLGVAAESILFIKADFERSGAVEEICRNNPGFEAKARIRLAFKAVEQLEDGLQLIDRSDTHALLGEFQRNATPDSNEEIRLKYVFSGSLEKYALDELENNYSEGVQKTIGRLESSRDFVAELDAADFPITLVGKTCASPGELLAHIDQTIDRLNHSQQNISQHIALIESTLLGRG
jgi:hypothetical protein